MRNNASIGIENSLVAMKAVGQFADYANFFIASIFGFLSVYLLDIWMVFMG